MKKKWRGKCSLFLYEELPCFKKKVVYEIIYTSAIDEKTH